MKNIFHKGINIFYMDFSNLTTKEDIMEKILEYNRFIISQEENSIHALTNVQNIFFNKDIFQNFHEFVLKNKPYIKKSAIIGVDGLTKVMFNAILNLTKRDLKLFNTIEEAKDFLAN